MEQLESACQDVPVPIEIEAVKQLISKIHAMKRSMLETLSSTLQEGKTLLEKLKRLASEGTLDSRPDNIRVSAERGKRGEGETWLEKLTKIFFLRKKKQLLTNAKYNNYVIG